MPPSNHIHKSMLLRGVKFPEKALNRADIEATKGRAARSGRTYGGAPLRSNGRGQNTINYGGSSSYQSSGPTASQSYQGFQNGYNGNHYPVPPPGWQPPPPGVNSFGRGAPPPPPGIHGAYNQGYQPYNYAHNDYSQPPAYTTHNGQRWDGRSDNYQGQRGRRGR